ncbi:spidroin-1-like [Penaeus indicus]|uniref:spidroin-1-like n=1 Tax=Penaeus indicus TaxID=29960 RepID=UPI00300CEB5A
MAENKLTSEAKCQASEGVGAADGARGEGPRAQAEALTSGGAEAAAGGAPPAAAPAAPSAAQRRAVAGGGGGGRGGQGGKGVVGQGSPSGGLRGRPSGFGEGGRPLCPRGSLRGSARRGRVVLALSAARVPGEQCQGVSRCLAADWRQQGSWRLAGILSGPYAPSVSVPKLKDFCLRMNFTDYPRKLSLM